MTMPRIDPLPINRYMDREADYEWILSVMKGNTAGQRHSAWALRNFCNQTYEQVIGSVSHVEEMQERWYEFVAPEVPDEEIT